MKTNENGTNLAKTEENNALDVNKQEEILGFEESDPNDIIVPRLKVINALSPERVDGIAQEGNIINSLTKDIITDAKFIPVKVYYSNIEWDPDRNAEVRMICRSLDGRIGTGAYGTLSCAACKRNQFDNSKTGKEAQPKCTAYINFLGFMDDNLMPVIVSFAKTNYNEGRKMLSIAKSLRESFWKNSYVLKGKKISKDKNVWYIIEPTLSTPTTAEQRTFAERLFRTYESSVLNADYEDTRAPVDTTTNVDMESEIV